MKLSHSLVEKWPSAIVARSMVSEFSGGVLSPGTMANVDSAGCGPPRMKFSRKVAYLTTDLARWMEENLADDAKWRTEFDFADEIAAEKRLRDAKECKGKVGK